MSFLAGAINTTINNGNFTAVSTTVVNNNGRNDIVAFLHPHIATAGLLNARERFDAPKCDEGTRTSMILGMKKFVQDGDIASSPALYWLHGPAGVGKSALAQSLALSLKSEGDHAASFFFSRTSPGRSNGNQLMLTLAYQLATSFPALQPYMSEVVKKDPAILTAANAVQMQSLIIDPINKWKVEHNRSIWRLVDQIFGNNKKLHPRLILVDGLDECHDRNVQKDLILCISLAVRRLTIPMRFVIASRPESHILATFELDPSFQGLDGVKFTRKNLGDDPEADEQITAYLLKEFAEIRRVHPIRSFLPEQWPRPNQIEQLVSKSSKGFIYPTTVIQYIKTDHNRPDECLERILGLSVIPTSDKPYEPLDDLYRHIFNSVPEINKTSIHEIFRFLVLPSTWDGATTPTIIERHFGYKPGHVRHVLRDLLCLVAFTSDGYIKVLHASLPDFLLDESRSGSLCIDVGDAHTAIAGSYLLDIRHHDTVLPSRRNGFADFLNHMMGANLSDTLIQARIPEMDVASQYMEICSLVGIRSVQDVQTFKPRRPWKGVPRFKGPLDDTSSESDKSEDDRYHVVRLNDGDIEGIAFMVAYLLLLVIRDGPHKYIGDQIAAIKAHILPIYPYAASVDAMYEQIIPEMSSLFDLWSQRIYDESIISIFKFAYEVAPSQNKIREAIFELHFLMMAPFCRIDISTENKLKAFKDPQPAEVITEGEPNFWTNIIRSGYIEYTMYED